MMEKLLGTTVNFGDAGTQHQGTIVAAWLDYEAGHAEYVAMVRDEEQSKDPRDPSYSDRSVRMVVACGDKRFREVWLTNCTNGAIPRKPGE